MQITLLSNRVVAGQGVVAAGATVTVADDLGMVFVDNGWAVDSSGVYPYASQKPSSLSLSPANKSLDAAINLASINNLLATWGDLAISYPGTLYVSGPIVVNNNNRIGLGRNTTLKLIDGLTNTPILKNADLVNGNSNIEITGGTWHGNAANHTRDDTSGTFSAFFMLLQKVRNLKVSDLRVVDPIAYGITIAACDQFEVSGITFDYATSKPNQDGVHMAGGNVNGTVRSLKGTTNDDMCAVISEDIGVYANATPKGSPVNITIEDIQSDKTVGTYRFVRLMDSATYPMENITVRTLKGYYYTGGVIMNTITGGTSVLRGVVLDDIDINPLPGTNPSVPTIQINQTVTDCKILNLRRHIASTETPQPIIGGLGSSTILKDLHVNGFYVVDDRTGATTTNYVDLDAASAVTWNLTIKNIQVSKATQAGNNLIRVGRCDLQKLIIDDISSSRLSRLVYFDNATGKVSTRMTVANFIVGNASASMIETTAAVAALAYIQLLNGNSTGTMSANGFIKFAGLTGTCLIDAANCDLQPATYPLLTRAGTESIRVRSTCSPVASTALTPARGDIILDSTASNDPKRWDGAAWQAL